MLIRRLFASTITLVLFLLPLFFLHAESGTKVFFTPSTGSFLTDSTFTVSVTLDTGGVPVNVIDLKIIFPADKLQVVNPSSGNSFVSLWLEQPTYSNTTGIVTFTGGVPEGGINTSNGLVSSIVFRVKQPGTATLKFDDSSSVLKADGSGTKIPITLGRGVYTLKQKAPDGPKVFSVTHPDETAWYQNNNIVVGWEPQDSAAKNLEFSYSISHSPTEIPSETNIIKETVANFSNIENGIWYVHVKQKQNGIYGETSHFRVNIDTIPPAEFNPTITLLSTTIVSGGAMINFFTTDSLSGINHYEIASFDPSKEAGEAPIFTEATSPYRISDIGKGTLRVVVRAVDNAGNIRDGFIDIKGANFYLTIIRNNYPIGIFIILIALLSYFVARLRYRRTPRENVALMPVPASWIEKKEEDERLE